MVEQSIDTERSLLDAIAAGDLDDHLDALAAAVGARRELLHTVRSVTRLMSLCEGDLVRINQRISPRYLARLHGTVVDPKDLEPLGKLADLREVHLPARVWSPTFDIKSPFADEMFGSRLQCLGHLGDKPG